MGQLEKESKRETRITNIQKVILLSVAATGILAFALVAGNVVQLIPKTKFFKRLPRKDSVNRSRDRLIKNGCLEYKDGFLRLTEKGEFALRQHEATEYKIKKPWRWDRKWRVIIFDIREDKRWSRDKLRMTLISIGFKRVQDSVWVYPYDCEDLINLLKADFKIGKDILYMIVDRLENDSWLKKEFGLKID
jgi:CRISPR-associated endonuclease Cas2